MIKDKTPSDGSESGSCRRRSPPAAQKNKEKHGLEIKHSEDKRPALSHTPDARNPHNEAEKQKKDDGPYGSSPRQHKLHKHRLAAVIPKEKHSANP